MKFNKLSKLLLEMPNFSLQGKKYKSEEDKEISEYDLKGLEKNIIVYFLENHFAFPPNYFLVYFMDTEKSAQNMLDGEITPPLIFDAGMSNAGTFDSLWRKKSTDKRVLGTVQGFIHGDKIVVKFMTVRSKARLQKINSRMIDMLKKEFPGKEVEYKHLTNQGKKFKTTYEIDEPVKKLKQYRGIGESKNNRVIAYHGGPAPIRNFDLKKSAMNIIWFSEDKDKILRGDAGVDIPKFIMTVELDVKNPAGWDEYNRLVLDQITSMGFDSVKLGDDWIVFDTDNIKVLNIEKV